MEWEHPDVDQPHEAKMLWEQMREMARLDECKDLGADFLRLLADSEAKSKELEAALRSGDLKAAGAAHAAVKQSCDACHAKYRNN
jgi:cytochrome c556